MRRQPRVVIERGAVAFAQLPRDVQAKPRPFRRSREERVKNIVCDVGIDAGAPVNDIQDWTILAIAAALEFDQGGAGKGRAMA